MHISEYENDENGNAIKITGKDPDGEITSISEYEYDENGNIIKWTIKNSEGEITSIIVSTNMMKMETQ